jgi:hypothetical protein
MYRISGPDGATDCFRQKTPGIIDNLTYYDKGNHLIGVDDAMATNNGDDLWIMVSIIQPLPKPLNIPTTKNGNLTADKNKGIVSIVFNFGRSFNSNDFLAPNYILE